MQNIVALVNGAIHYPKTPSLFQIADVESGVIRWVNADCVQNVLIPFMQNVVDINDRGN